ncbi:MAG: hypothetical protein AB8F74_13815 [Saprospiraceae bacterium]
MVLGLFKEQVNIPFGKIALDAISQLGLWLDLATDNSLEIINEAGNIPSLCEKILDTKKLQKQVVVFKYRSPKVREDILMEVLEENEATEDELLLANSETDIHEELAKIDQEIFSEEEAKWEAIENKTKSKQKRISRIEGRMKRIIKEEEKLLKAGLTKEVVIQKQINLLLSQVKVLTKDLQKRKLIIGKQKDTVEQLRKSNKKDLFKKEQERRKLERRLGDQKTMSSIIALLAQAHQNNKIRIESLNHLKKNDGKPNVIQHLEDGIKKTNKEIEKLNEKKKTIQEIDKIDSEINNIKSAAGKLRTEQHKLSILQRDKKQTDDLVSNLQQQLSEKNNSLTSAIKERETSISVKQIKLQDLNKRLKRLLEKVNGLSYRFKSQLKRSLDDSYYEELRQKVFRDRESIFLEQIAQEDFNLFLIRLIQVRQWMNGYYYGRLDSQPADRTFKSIVEFTDEEDLPRLRLKYILTKLGESQKGFWLLNAQYYFECIVELDKSATTNDTTELIETYQESIEGNKKIYTNENTRKAWIAYNKELGEGLDGSEHRIRRFYFGVKSMARSIGRVMKRIVRFIIKGTKIVLRILKNFIKIIYKEIREGTRNFLDGMSFLFSRRSIHTPGVNEEQAISRYAFDFDSMVLMTDTISPETVDSHIRNCMLRTGNLHFSLRLCGKIVKWVIVIATGTVTWPRLALKIAFYFKDLVKEYIGIRKRKKKRIKKEIS